MKQLENTENKILQVTVACMKLNQTLAEMTSDKNVLVNLESQLISFSKLLDFIANTLHDVAGEVADEAPKLARKMAERGLYE